MARGTGFHHAEQLSYLPILLDAWCSFFLMLVQRGDIFPSCARTRPLLAEFGLDPSIAESMLLTRAQWQLERLKRAPLLAQRACPILCDNVGRVRLHWWICESVYSARMLGEYVHLIPGYVKLFAALAQLLRLDFGAGSELSKKLAVSRVAISDQNPRLQPCAEFKHPNDDAMRVFNLKDHEIPRVCPPLIGACCHSPEPQIPVPASNDQCGTQPVLLGRNSPGSTMEAHSRPA